MMRESQFGHSARRPDLSGPGHRTAKFRCANNKRPLFLPRAADGIGRFLAALASVYAGAFPDWAYSVEKGLLKLGAAADSIR